MKEVLYIEIPTPDLPGICAWLHQEFKPRTGKKTQTPQGCRLVFPNPGDGELSIFVWSLQRTTYLKVFRWGKRPVPQETQILLDLQGELRQWFPLVPVELPRVDLSQQSIFTALESQYPKTVHFFQKMPNGEADLSRVYWWEQQWRQGVRQPQNPKPVVFPGAELLEDAPTYDLIYVGGALGIIHATVMARLGHRVLLIERLPFSRMNREWNISREEFQTLIDLGLFSIAEFEELITQEYKDGFNKFFDANTPSQVRAPVLHTPTVLNIGLDAEPLLRCCGQKFREAGGIIWDETEFVRADFGTNQMTVQATHRPSNTPRQAQGRLLVDAMGTASPIAWQLTGGRPFDSVCPTVGAVIADGFPQGVWDNHYGDVLHSHGDISRGRQLIWELFPGRNQELTVYLFHYHRIHPDNPGSLLEMYEDFFTILPEYRRCDPEQLVWKKATFGYIPGYFSLGRGDRQVGFDRLIAIGDAASLQSPLIFTGFGSLVRNLPRLTDLMDTALRHDLLEAQFLDQVRAYQSNVAVTWLFSKGMMVPHGQSLHPARINAMLNTFFGVMTTEPPAAVESFLKDRVGWFAFNRMALKAAWTNPSLLLWIWQLAGRQDMVRWLSSYLYFSLRTLLGWVLQGWFPYLVRSLQGWLEPRYPRLWFWLLAQDYALAADMGWSLMRPRLKAKLASKPESGHQTRDAETQG